MKNPAFEANREAIMNKNIILSLVAALILIFCGIALYKCNGGGGGGGKGLLKGAFNYSGKYPAPAIVSYTAKDGKTYKTWAFPGQVCILFNKGNTASVAKKLIESSKGKIIAQIPQAGIYWVSVTPGSEAGFISTVSQHPSVLNAFPNISIGGLQDVVDLGGATSLTPIIPSANSIIAQIDLDCDPASEDSNCKDISHLAAVRAIAEKNGQSVGSYDICTDTTEESLLNIGIGSISDFSFGLARLNDGALVKGQKLVVNLSMGPEFGNCSLPSPPPECNGVTEFDMLNQNGVYLAGIAQEMEALSDEALDNMLVVIASGNDGLDLTPVIAEIKVAFPRAWEHIIMAGAVDESGQVFTNFNYSSNGGDMLYKPGVGVTMPGTPGCLLDGTSFSAPQVSDEIAQILQKTPAAKTSDAKNQVIQKYCAGNASSCTGATCCSGNTCQGGFCQQCSENGQSCGSTPCCPGYTCQNGKCGIPCSVSSDCYSGCCNSGFCGAIGSCSAPCPGNANSECSTGCCKNNYCMDSAACKTTGGGTAEECSDWTPSCADGPCGSIRACSKCTFDASGSGTCQGWYETGDGVKFSCSDSKYNNGQVVQQMDCTAAASSLSNYCCPPPPP